MYSLTFCVRVTTTPQYGWNGTAHAAGASMLSPVRGVFAGMRVCVCGMRAACGGPGGLPLDSAMHFHSVATATQPVHRLQIRPIVHNYGASPTTPPSYIRVRAIAQACGRRQTHTHRHTDAHVTKIHFSWSTTHVKCNNELAAGTVALAPPASEVSQWMKKGWALIS